MQIRGLVFYIIGTSVMKELNHHKFKGQFKFCTVYLINNVLKLRENSLTSQKLRKLVIHFEDEKLLEKIIHGLINFSHIFHFFCLPQNIWPLAKQYSHGIGVKSWRGYLDRARGIQ